MIQFINVAEGLLHSVQLLCKLLSTIEPLTISEVVQDLKQTTLLLLHATRDQRSSDVFSPTIDDEVCIDSKVWGRGIFCYLITQDVAKICMLATYLLFLNKIQGN